MSQTNLNLRMDEDLKQAFSAFCSEVGLTMSAAVTLFATTVVRQQRIPFEIGTDAPNAETLAAFAEVEDMKKHPERYPAYTDLDALFRDLEA